MAFESLQPLAHFVIYSAANAEQREYYVNYQRDAQLSAQYDRQFCGPHHTWRCPVAQEILFYRTLEDGDIALLRMQEALVAGAYAHLLP